jgi:hypothetical protein
VIGLDSLFREAQCEILADSKQISSLGCLLNLQRTILIFIFQMNRTKVTTIENEQEILAFFCP